jgi:hypothetical protein
MGTAMSSDGSESGCITPLKAGNESADEEDIALEAFDSLLGAWRRQSSESSG